MQASKMCLTWYSSLSLRRCSTFSTINEQKLYVTVSCMIQSLNYDKVQREMRVNSDFDYLHIDSFIRFTIMLVS